LLFRSLCSFLALVPLFLSFFLLLFFRFFSCVSSCLLFFF
jgi:hypothetical protein